MRIQKGLYRKCRLFDLMRLECFMINRGDTPYLSLAEVIDEKLREEKANSNA